ncbi:MAG: ABC transporter permease [Muribaculaceae bacterium]|nr:ABC transporter permease [Muribaculaceae bacterium]
MKDNRLLLTIIRREYVERVSRKIFILSTILTPLLMIGLMLLPALLMKFNIGDTLRYTVVDNSGVIADKLTNSQVVAFSRETTSIDSLRGNNNIDGILVIGSDIIDNNSSVSLYNRGAGSIDAEAEIVRQIKDAIELERIKAYDIDNLPEILSEIEADVDITTHRIDSDDNSPAMSSTTCFIIGMTVTFLLYTLLMFYGQMVMSSIIEEKNNKVVELIISSVKPQLLMLGKIIGIGLVAVTQIAIWAIIICGSAQLLLSFSFTSVPATATITDDMALNNIPALFSNPAYLLQLFLYLTLFLIGGYLLYAAIFAAIGASVDNMQDASQLVYFAYIPIIIAVICATIVGRDPNSSMALWLSFIPFTSPMIMMTRIPHGIPGWEIFLSIALLYVSFIAMTLVAAKIYRVGILMHGRKPSIKEILRWLKYS